MKSKNWEKTKNSFDTLPNEQKSHIHNMRKELNETFYDMSLEKLESRFFIKYIKDE